MFKLITFLMLVSTQAFASRPCIVSELRIFSEHPDKQEKTWMVADGRTLDKAKFRELADVLKGEYPAGDITFEIPDLERTSAGTFYICVKGAQGYLEREAKVGDVRLFASPKALNRSDRIHDARGFETQAIQPFQQFHMVTGGGFSDNISKVYFPKLLPVISNDNRLIKIYPYLVVEGVFPAPGRKAECLKGEKILVLATPYFFPANVQQDKTIMKSYVSSGREGMSPALLNCL